MISPPETVSRKAKAVSTVLPVLFTRDASSPTITARLNFQLAFGARVGQRLSEAREETRREATKDRSRRPGTAIALRDKDVELHDYYRSASKARGTWQASRATAGYSSAARRAGDRAGKRARLGNSPELPGARTSLGR